MNRRTSITSATIECVADPDLCRSATDPARIPGPHDASFEHFVKRAGKRRESLQAKHDFSRKTPKDDLQIADAELPAKRNAPDPNNHTPLELDNTHSLGAASYTSPPPLDATGTGATESAPDLHSTQPVPLPQPAQATEPNAAISRHPRDFTNNPDPGPLAPPPPGGDLHEPASPDQFPQRGELREPTPDSAATGTNSAQSASRMKNAAKTGQSQQHLPVDSPGARNTAVTPDDLFPAPWSFSPEPKISCPPLNPELTYRGAAETVPISPAVAAQDVPTAESRTSVLNEAIEAAVTEFRHESPQSMVVVVRADGDTHIRLHITGNQDVIHVRARVERGEIANLNEHWLGLQRELQPRGIILAGIESTAPLPAHDANGATAFDFRQRHNRFPADEPERLAPGLSVSEPRLHVQADSSLTDATPDTQPSNKAKFEGWA